MEKKNTHAITTAFLVQHAHTTRTDEHTIRGKTDQNCCTKIEASDGKRTLVCYWQKNGARVANPPRKAVYAAPHCRACCLPATANSPPND